MKPGTKKLVLAFLFCFLALVGEVIGYVAVELVGGDETLVPLGCCLAVTLVGVLAVGGFRSLVPTTSGLKIVWHVYGWSVIVSLGLAVWQMSEGFSEGMGVVSVWPQQLAYAALLMLLVGFSEELSFRGLFEGGLLARFGRTRRGLAVCLLLVALVFGLSHVDFSTLNTSDPLQVGQAVLKVVQTGIGGFALAVAVADGSGLVWPALFHAFDNFLLFVPSALLEADMSSDVEYVSTGDEGFFLLIFYVIVCVLYIPIVVRSVKACRRLRVPSLGPLVGEEAPELEPEEELGNDARPPAPDGLAH